MRDESPQSTVGTEARPRFSLKRRIEKIRAGLAKWTSRT